MHNINFRNPNKAITDSSAESPQHRFHLKDPVPVYSVIQMKKYCVSKWDSQAALRNQDTKEHNNTKKSQDLSSIISFPRSLITFVAFHGPKAEGLCGGYIAQ